MLAEDSRISAQLRISIEHWRELLRDRKLPTLSDMLDSAIPAIQPWTSVIDVDDANRQPIRLMGTGLVKYFGADITGHDFLSIVSASAQGYLRAAHAILPQLPCGVLFRGMCFTSTGREVMLEGLGLPYAARGNCVVWHLNPLARLDFSENGLEIREILSADWIDLGCGEPRDFAQH